MRCALGLAEWQRWYAKIGRKPFVHLTKAQRARMVRGCIGKVIYDSHEEARRVVESLPPIPGKGAGSYDCRLCHGIHVGNSRSRKGAVRMNYTKVEDSQIAEVGFGEGYYGPETLGIRFQPSKKQAAAGNTGSEYHYGNDRAPHSPSQTHARLIAAPDTGKWFGENIEKRPDLYPYVKIEDGKTYDIPLFESTPGAIAPAQEEPAPTTALAVIDTMADDLLFTPNAVTDAQLAAGREWYLTEAKKYDISTEKNRAELKRFVRPLQKLRTGIEARAKELTGATKRKIAAIDAEKRRLVLLVGGIEDEVLRPLTEWEQEEDTRKTRLSGICTRLAQYGQMHWEGFASLEAIIAELEFFDLSTMQEYKVGAESAIAASLKILKPELERRRVAEANEAELAKLRAEAAERAERDRVAQIAADARVEAERKAAAEVAVAQARAEQAEKMRIADEQNAVRRAEEAASQAKREQEAAVEAERRRNTEATERAQAEAAARAADVAHRTKANYEATSALVAECLIDEPSAHEVIAAIAKGLIPHISINY